ncbi:hypothetical protein CYMTET_35680 [Cymbomonas tetramitiformis]|uniref:Exonuclease domain-containing protein n=1 Tax=Cymbomonas tetramitiformis TaxID=36881 RepID=A0AAE0F8X0_9CHLO|nr:hypothetical protein CYMTET_35680 [Cymbomonas tetramitiformis]|eukprot:gene295-550_t
MRVRTVVFDLETSGLSTNHCDIISLAMRVLETDEHFYEVVRPPRLPVPRKICELTGLTNEELRTKARWPHVGARMCAWLRCAVLMNKDDVHLVLTGHNCRRFDVPILVRHLEMLRDIEPVTPRRCRVVDTLHLFKRAIPGMRSYKQGVLYRHLFKQELEGAHSAFHDVRALARMLRDERSLFEGLARRAVEYDIEDRHELADCRHVFRVTKRETSAKRQSASLRVAWSVIGSARTTETASPEPPHSMVRNERCGRCRVVYSNAFSHTCATPFADSSLRLFT